MKLYICNAFSLSMLDREVQTHRAIEDCCENGDVSSFIGELVTLAETYAR